LLHATALCELREGEEDLEVIEGLDKDAVEYELDEGVLFNAHNPTFLVYTWILDTLTKRQDSGGLCVPPPICSRLFQTHAEGFLGYNNCTKIQNTPFPFAYVQIIQLALLALALTFPFIVHVFVNSAFFGVLFSMLTVGGFSALNEVAVQIECPYGNGANDLSIPAYQRAFNNRIRPLLHLDEGPYQTPALSLSYAAMLATYTEGSYSPLSPHVPENAYDNYVDELENGLAKGDSKADPRVEDINANFSIPFDKPDFDLDTLAVDDMWKLVFVSCENTQKEE